MKTAICATLLSLFIVTTAQATSASSGQSGNQSENSITLLKTCGNQTEAYQDALVRCSEHTDDVQELACMEGISNYHDQLQQTCSSAESIVIDDIASEMAYNDDEFSEDIPFETEAMSTPQCDAVRQWYRDAKQLCDVAFGEYLGSNLKCKIKTLLINVKLRIQNRCFFR